MRLLPLIMLFLGVGPDCIPEPMGRAITGHAGVLHSLVVDINHNRRMASGGFADQCRAGL